MLYDDTDSVHTSFGDGTKTKSLYVKSGEVVVPPVAYKEVVTSSDAGYDVYLTTGWMNPYTGEHFDPMAPCTKSVTLWPVWSEEPDR